MKIRKIKLTNFRCYKEEVTINFNDLSVFVGKNDIGKSTILEALDIFLNENKGTIKIDKDDVNKKAKDEDDTEIKITVVFEDLPACLTIDSSNKTSLKDEYLLQSDGSLEIVKKYPNAGKEKVFIVARHPTNPLCKDLLLKKNDELKKILEKSNIKCEDKTRNAEIRKAIWCSYSNDLQLQEIEIELAKEDAKNTWGQLKNYMPLYSLFQSDRKNSDGDSEIQNPMKFAVQEILKDPKLMASLNEVAKSVADKLNKVSKKTLEKIQDMDEEIAKSLNPVIPTAESLKWADVFKNVSITGDENIPINKRGSGVKRLILLSFFRAEAERKKEEKECPDIIYAIEEPETSQHPNYQRKLIKAFIDLSKTDNTQIILTTHSPPIVKLLAFEYLQLIKEDDGIKIDKVEKADLPYPSLNEVNFLAFGEANEEYHNELYGYISEKNWLNIYQSEVGATLSYTQQNKKNNVSKEIILSTYIRHQIHHPENKLNPRFTPGGLKESINEMRKFIKKKTHDSTTDSEESQ